MVSTWRNQLFGELWGVETMASVPGLIVMTDVGANAPCIDNSSTETLPACGGEGDC